MKQWLDNLRQISSRVLRQVRSQTTRRLTASRLIGLVPVAALSVTAWLVVRHANLVLAYNDSMSHLNIARRVIDNLQPGLAQIGTVWLPLNHLLYLPLIWNDWAWRTGFAGSLTSMVAYVVGVAGVYCTVRLLAGKRLPAVVGAVVFALNLNLLYLQATPLTEAVFLALLVWAIYCFAAFVRTEDTRALIGLGALGFLLVLARYDGWFVVAVLSALLLIHQLRAGRPLRDAFGKVAVMASPAIFAVALWVLWNASFGNPLYFMTGHGSAKAQQDIISAGSGLLAKGHPFTAVGLYGAAVINNAGLQITLLGLIGAGYYAISRSHRDRLSTRLLIIGALAAPIIFNMLALYLGFSTISLPEFSTAADRSQWFNVRYGIIALPALAVAVGLFARWSRPVALALVAIVVLQAGQHLQSGLITVADGTKGSSAFTDSDISGALSQHVRPGEYVLMSFSEFNPISLTGGLPMRQYIHEGVQRAWTPALDDPTRYASWIVMSKNDAGDPVYEALRKTHHNDFEQTFHLVYSGEHADVYRRNEGVSVTSGLRP